MSDYLAPLALIALWFAVLVIFGLLAFGWGNPFPPVQA